MAKLLIVDDDAQACEYMAELFSKRGQTVISALSGKEGLKAARKEKPDVVLLDVSMPDMDGLSLLKEIKRINKDIRVIMVTVASDESVRQEAQKLGADDFVKKPIQKDELVGKVCVNISKRSDEKEK